MPTVSKILTMLMVRDGLSDNELAEKTGIPQPTISRIKNGTARDPRDSTLRPLAQYFGLTVSQLRGDMPLPTDSVKVAANDEVEEVSLNALNLAKAIDALSPDEQSALQTLINALTHQKNGELRLKVG